MIIEINDFAWNMKIDLTYVCDRAGQREKYYDQYLRAHSYIPFKLTQARKIFRLIKQYADEGVALNALLYIKRYSQETGRICVLREWEKA